VIGYTVNPLLKALSNLGGGNGKQDDTGAARQ